MISFVCLVVVVAVLQFYLVGRQSGVLKKNRNEVPNYFRQKIKIEAHQKSIDYSLVKLNLQKYTIFVEMVLMLVFTIFGGLNLVAYLASTVVQQPGILRDILLILLFSFFNYLLTLPLTVYSIFGIETQFGFNNMAPKLFLRDQVKGLILGAIFLIPITFVVLYLLRWIGSMWWFYTWLVWIGLSLFLLWIYPKWIAPIFNTFKPLEDEVLKSRIEGLLRRTGFQSDGIFVMDGSKRSGHANAYFSGFGKNKRIVFFDTLLKDMNPEEVEAILAHELGHFKLKHVLKQMAGLFLLALVVLYVLGLLINSPKFYLGLGVEFEHISNGMGLLLFFLVLPVFTFILSPLSSVASRKNEYEADRFATEVTSADDLISALVKLYSSNASSLVTDKFYSFFYDSHPNAEDRIVALESTKKENDR
ncbi:MAG: M48 family metalloprotease [Neisseriaceae bacterium]|nr:MAG: M48 family metalloprotease [Neisseriaceae bacterium]